MPYGTVVADVIQNTTGYSLGAGNASIMKNRIINGAMVIDQRNAGASVTITADGTYTLDRWKSYSTQASKYSVQQLSASPPAGFSNYLGVTSASAYSITSTDYFAQMQFIEGFNTADLQWGTANAKTVTLSAWVYSSLTGTFGGSIQNSAFNRSYPFTYTISSANTWTQISVTIAGDTSGTWIGATNGKGMAVFFGIGVGSTFSGTAGAWASANYLSATGATSVVGTNGATFYITGVQLEVGSSATGFEYRMYGTELANCQRYYVKGMSTGATSGALYASTAAALFFKLPVTMRTAPTNSLTTGTTVALDVAGVGTPTGTLGGFDKSSEYGFRLLLNIDMSGSIGAPAQINTGVATVQSSAEL